MAEKTLNEALNGAEIKEIILQQISKRMDGDCTLADSLAYAGFSMQFDMRIQYLRSTTKPTQVWGVGSSSQEPITPESIESTVVVSVSHTSAASPDVERQNHDLSIPVLVQTPAGMERKKVKVGRPKAQ